MSLKLKQTIYLLFVSFLSFPLMAQNLNGQKIMVGTDAPAFIILHDEVVNAEFNSAEGSKYYNCKVRNNNSMSITFKAEALAAPDNIGLAVQEGKRNHYFIITFNKNYDINRDPPLWYDYSNLKELKKYVQQKSSTKEEPDKIATAEKEKAAQEEENRKKEIADAQKNAEAEAAKRKQQMEDAKKQDLLKQQELDKQLAKAKEEERIKGDELKKAEAIKKKNEDDRKKAEALLQKLQQDSIKTAAVTKKKTEDDKKAAELAQAKMNEKERQQAQALADKKAEAERKKAEGIAKAKEEDDRKKAEVLAAAKAEEDRRKKIHDDALSRLKQLEDEKEKQRQARAYSRVGLWERYGSKGINIFDIPEKQISLVNADFYLIEDTLRNYNISQELLNNQIPALNINGEKTVNGGVSIVLESITFNAPNAYFKIHIVNKSKDDFLMGATGTYWYNADGSPKKWLNCSYITYIQSFPIIPPGQEARIVLVTRDANIQDDETLDINMSERRPEREKLDIIFAGKVYNNERKKIEKKIIAEQAPEIKNNPPEEKKKKNRKEKN